MARPGHAVIKTSDGAEGSYHGHREGRVRGMVPIKVPAPGIYQELSHWERNFLQQSELNEISSALAMLKKSAAAV